MSAVSETDFSSVERVNEAPWGYEQLFDKTQAVWNQVYGGVTAPFRGVVNVARSAVGAVVRDLFFFSLKGPLISLMRSAQQQLQVEADYCRNFWDPEKPLDPYFQDHEAIREKFHPPKDHTITIALPNGTPAEITVRIVETKANVGEYYNFVHVPGIFSTIENSAGVIYPYLSAYVRADLRTAAEIPPARFMIISENNLNIKPSSVEEAGLILLETLKALRQKFGEVDQLVAESLGNLFLGSALKQAESPKDLSQRICLMRGPTNIWEASKKYFWGLGRLIYFVAKFGRWNFDVEQSIVDFKNKWKEKAPAILVTGVKQDHRFGGSANLCLSKKVAQVKGIRRLLFDPPRQIINAFGQHTMSPADLNKVSLVGWSDVLTHDENLAQAIIRHSILKSTAAAIA